jgi:hypothetical protein
LTSRDEGGGPGLYRRVANRNDPDRASIASSSTSFSPSDLHSVSSSPSPSRDDQNEFDKEHLTGSRRSASSVEGSLASPFPSFEAQRASSLIEPRAEKVQSLTGSIVSYLEVNAPDANNDNGIADVVRHLGHESLLFTPALTHSREQLAIPPVSVETSGSKSTPIVNNIPPPVTSSSPSSSLDSASYFASHTEFFSFEAQLKSSPVINDIVERLVRYEAATREIQRDLSDIHRKVNLILERSSPNAPPEFKDPFSPTNLSNANINGPRPSIPLAPHQPLPNNVASSHQGLAQGVSGGDDVGQISQRLNALTSSVGQLLALQTQQIQASNAGLSNNQTLGGGLQQDIAAGLMSSSLNSAAILGHGHPASRGELRQSPRPPAPPIRTWSAGSLDLPPRVITDASASMRQDPIFRDKRRSAVGPHRRDSASVSLVSLVLSHISQSIFRLIA